MEDKMDKQTSCTDKEIDIRQSKRKNEDRQAGRWKDRYSNAAR